MKKLCSVFLTLIMLFSLTASACAVTVKETTASGEAGFDQSILAGSAFYKYDKFEKTWNAQASYKKIYNDAEIYVYLMLFDTYVDKGWGPELRVRYFNKDKQGYDTVTAFRAIIGDTIFRFEKMTESSNNNNSYVFACNTLKEFCVALASHPEAEIAFQIIHTDKYGSSWRSTIDPVDNEALRDIIEFAALLNASNAWSTAKAIEIYDDYYGASFE